jgi:hypothetical protein
MPHFNKLHSLIIAKVYNLPFLIETYFKYDSDSFKHEDKTMSYDEIIDRFKAITNDFPRDVGLENNHFKKDFDDVPYPIIKRAFHTIIEDAIGHCWKLKQLDEQFIPFTKKMFDAFPEINFGEKSTPEKIKKSIELSALYFLNCSKSQSKDKDFINDVNNKIDQVVNRMTVNYDGRYDNLPCDYSYSMISKYVHIKTLEVAKRTPVFFDK